MEPEIISNLISVAPVVAVLLWVVLYFRAKEKEYKEEIKELNNHLRESQIENISLMKDIATNISELATNIRELTIEIKR